MKEKLLVLAKAAPIVSKEYEHLICVAGITESGEWRRVYPVPLKLFWTGRGFKKKSWIEYELQSEGPSNHRPESRKIKSESVKQLGEDDYSNIHDLLQSKLTTLEELHSKGHKEVSLGVVKPEIIDFYDSENKHFEEMKEKSKQQTLKGGSVIKIDIPEKEFSYIFKCSRACSTRHDMLCEDWEVAELYRNCKRYQKIGKYPDEKTVISKVRQKMYDWILQRKEVYFVVGTHFRFGTYIIIGVIYPRNADTF